MTFRVQWRRPVPVEGRARRALEALRAALLRFEATGEVTFGVLPGYRDKFYVEVGEDWVLFEFDLEELDLVWILYVQQTPWLAGGP